MTAYAFEALDSQGKTIKDLIDADSPRAARSILRARGLAPVSVQPAVASAQAEDGAETSLLQWQIFTPRVLNQVGLTIWTRQLAGLVTSGLPLERALTALGEEAEKPELRNLLASLRAEVNAGASFAKALQQHPKEFDEIYTAVISAGEGSGNLGLVLDRLADDLEEQQALRSKIMGAALYPMIVSLIAVFIVAFLVTYVVPQVAGVFAGTKKALPMLTTMMLGFSAFVRQWWWLMLLLLAAVVGGFWQLRKQPETRLKIDAAWLRLPLIGRLARGYNSARFASTLAMLVGAGVPILRALQAAAETLSNKAMQADALDALVLVREGAPLASALAQKKRFPGILAMFARLGEQTGQLPLMLQRAARQLSAEVQRRAMQLATILEPLLIVAMGGVVMLIVLAVLMPIIQLNQLVK
ncbi:MAG: type II secretion system inner membrane protein GspF [Brachymonas sp.]|jgi:general secretion pathway protein F